MNALRAWRRQRRERTYFARAQERAGHMSETEIVEQIDIVLMGAGRSISNYRHTQDPDPRLDQLLELRMALEASLGMLDRVLPG